MALQQRILSPAAAIRSRLDRNRVGRGRTFKHGSQRLPRAHIITSSCEDIVYINVNLDIRTPSAIGVQVTVLAPAGAAGNERQLVMGRRPAV